MNVALASAGASVLTAPLPRTSDVLRGVLTRNPGVQRFSVERILATIGVDRAEVSLLMFSLPGIVPVQAPATMVSLPAGALGYRLASGRKQLQIPRFILKKSISRRALAVAVHAVLPALQAAEKMVRPRWSWINHDVARRVLGVFILLLAVSIAFPLFGFTGLHATSIFVMALGMAEQDGVAVLVGVAVGVLSLAIVAVSGLSARAWRAKASRWLRQLGHGIGMDLLARFLRSHGYDRLAHMLKLKWKSLLLLWDPEARPSAPSVTPPRVPPSHGPSGRRVPRAPSQPAPRRVAAGHVVATGALQPA